MHAIASFRRAAHRRSRQATGRILLLPLILLTLVFGAVTFIAFVLWPRWPEPPIAADAPSLPITIANVPFNLPPAAIPGALTAAARRPRSSRSGLSIAITRAGRCRP